jgi:dynein intermediate chain 1
LKQEKHHHLCEHPAMKKAKALHVSFNKVDPIILVGDERGGVNSFKLSKSLTKGPLMPAPGDDKTTPQMLEMKKMEDFLNAQDKEVY